MSSSSTHKKSSVDPIVLAAVQGGRQIGLGLSFLALAIFAVGAAWIATTNSVSWQLPVAAVIGAAVCVGLAFDLIEPVASTKSKSKDADIPVEEDDRTRAEKLYENYLRNVASNPTDIGTQVGPNIMSGLGKAQFGYPAQFGDVHTSGSATEFGTDKARSQIIEAIERMWREAQHGDRVRDDS